MRNWRLEFVKSPSLFGVTDLTGVLGRFWILEVIYLLDTCFFPPDFAILINSLRSMAIRSTLGCLGVL